MDDKCCREFCRKLDEWVKDERMATKEYHAWSEKARKRIPAVGILLETLSADEKKHAKALNELAMIVCK